MADNLNYTDGRDDARINVNQAHEVSYWTGKWNITEEVLRRAVAAAGVMVRDVEGWLRKNGYVK